MLPSISLAAYPDVLMTYPLKDDALREWLVDLRTNAGLNQSDVDRKTRQMGERYRVSQSYLSQIERGTRPVEDLSPTKMDALRKVYNVSPEEWVTKTGISIFVSSDIPPITLKFDALERMGAQPLETWNRGSIPVLGEVAAGSRGSIAVENVEEYISDSPALQDYDLEDLYALKVTGNSMVSDNVKLTVPHGAYVVVHRKLKPARGFLVVAWIADLDQGVVKEFGEDEDVILSSYAPSGPVFRASLHPFKIQGVVVEVRYVPSALRALKESRS